MIKKNETKNKNVNKSLKIGKELVNSHLSYHPGQTFYCLMFYRHNVIEAKCYRGKFLGVYCYQGTPIQNL